MENNQTIYQYVTYKFYDEKGRRLAIFGIHSEEGLKVITITCSKKDTFIKDRAKALFSAWTEGEHKLEVNPTVEFVAVSNNKPKSTFLDFCKFKYKRQRERSIQVDFASEEKGFVGVDHLSISKRKGKFVLDFIEKY